MKSAPKPCPACGGSDFSLLTDFGTVPRSGTFLESREESFPTLQLSFDYCTTCALLRQNWRGESIPHDYREVPRATSRQLPSYTAQIADSLKERGIGPNDLIVEVGANDGAFMDLLSERGFVNLIGIEPSKACAAICRKQGHQVEEEYLSEGLIEKILRLSGLAKAVICRHVLEHVPEPEPFLKNIRSLLGNEGILYLEVPSSQTILHDLYGHELWDEHLHLFGPENLRHSLRKAGFAILAADTFPQRGTENILIWASPNPSHESFGNETPEWEKRDLVACSAFSKSWNILRRECTEFLGNGGISAIGASHPQSNFLLFSGLGTRLENLVDDDPVKAGRFVPIPEPVSVITSKDFLARPAPKAVLLIAFGYNQWMEHLITPLVGRGVRFLDPYRPRNLRGSIFSTTLSK